jgi:hypothetical protein
VRRALAVAAIVVLYLAGWFFVGVSWPLLVYDFAKDVVLENGEYFVKMVAGWTAWVGLCVLLYIAGEWLITSLLGRSSR